jgi:2-keto-4-pentenoate hydratase/2-oxohepta-3-ene-1,7-dioic acid hydratase in catechol pathway
MKLGIFERIGGDGRAELGVVTGGGVVAVESSSAPNAERALKNLIANFAEWDPRLEGLVAGSAPIPLDQVRFLPPLPEPAKILCSLKVVLIPEGAEQRHVFLKGTGSVIGDDREVVLPELGGAEIFTANVCLAVVIGSRCRSVAAADWREVVFGYTAMVDITARTAEHSRWKGGKSALGSSCDTFGPLGPWIVPRDRFDEADDSELQLLCNGTLRQQVRVGDLAERIGETIEIASTVMTLEPGDLIAIEATEDGRGPVQDGDVLEADLGGFGRVLATVRDPAGRSWDPSILVRPGADTTEGKLPLPGTY